MFCMLLCTEEEAISLRQILAKVQSEKDSLEAEFCKKRAKFKTMYLQMEGKCLLFIFMPLVII